MCKFNFTFITFIYYVSFIHDYTRSYSIQFSLAGFNKFIAAYEIHLYVCIYCISSEILDIYKNTFDSG